MWENVTPRIFSNLSNNYYLYLSRRENLGNSQKHIYLSKSDMRTKDP